MATSILVNRSSDVERLARLILRDLGHRRRTILKTLGVQSTERAMQAVAEVVSRTVAAGMRHGVPPERLRFHLLLRPRRVRHSDGVPRDGYRVDLRLRNDGEVEAALCEGEFRDPLSFPQSTEEDGVHLMGRSVSEDTLKEALLTAWEAIKDANRDVIALRRAGILEPDRPLLAFEMFLGPVVLGEERAVRLRMRRARLVENLAIVTEGSDDE